jgi:predicted dehydrogenase
MQTLREKPPCSVCAIFSEIAMMNTSRATWTRRALLAGAAAAASPAAVLRLPAPVRVAIVGVEGHPGEITQPLDTMPDVQVAAVADADADALARFQRSSRHLAKARTYRDYRRMLDAEKPDVVAVCNSNGERVAAILEAARRQHHVIAEKPLAMTRGDLERVKTAVAGNRVRLGMLLPMRFAPPFLMLKQIVDRGEIGEVVQISAQKSYQLEDRPDWFKHRETYGSTILWIGPHMLDLMRFTSGRSFREVASFMGRPQFSESGSMETSTATCLRLDNGGTATLHMDYCRPATAPTHGDDRLRLAGTRGVAEYMESTGVVLMTVDQKPHRVENLPAAGSVFRDYIAHVYAGAPTSLPLADIYAVCEAAIAAHEAAIQNRLIPLA